MPNHESDFIAGTKTCADWKVARAQLVDSDDTATWESVFKEFFLKRLELRYLGPIKVLQDNGTFQGEGFSIAAIQCSLIEFLESAVQGTSYRYHLRAGETLGSFEYSSSKAIFESFLTTRIPFRDEFTDSVARDFYEGVRCGLLHEAQTKKGWRIRAIGSRIIDADGKILFRDNFQNGLLQFVEDYGIQLRTNKEYQAAFIRKFDSLCHTK
ncbi:MAG: hypothetical protein ACLP2H_09960 [Terriglobales bacterium]